LRRAAAINSAAVLEVVLREPDFLALLPYPEFRALLDRGFPADPFAR
jgi:hypothetical protein